jgi:dCMP deaminase
MKDSTWIELAKLIADKESKCVSRKVCAIIVKDDRLKSTGHNGTSAKQPNCCDVNKHLLDSSGNFISDEHHKYHQDWSKIHEIHAEINALMFCSPEDRVNATMYCTLQPCPDCAKAISNSGITKLVYVEEYPRSSPESNTILRRANINVVHYKE